MARHEKWWLGWIRTELLTEVASDWNTVAVACRGTEVQLRGKNNKEKFKLRRNIGDFKI